jgi:hypothetical protein
MISNYALTEAIAVLVRRAEFSRARTPSLPGGTRQHLRVPVTIDRLWLPGNRHFLLFWFV